MDNDAVADGGDAAVGEPEDANLRAATDLDGRKRALGEARHGVDPAADQRRLLGDVVDGDRPHRRRIDIAAFGAGRPLRSAEHTSESQTLTRIPTSVYCWKKKTH